MIIVGITGSIGMGKSTVAAMFEKLGIPSHDADAAVHRLMSPRGDAYRAIVCAFPYFQYPSLYSWKKTNGARLLKRKALGALVFKNADARAKLEGILHPLVRADQNMFIKEQKRMGRKYVALDIPLLFETDAQNFVDVTVCVSAPNYVQKCRVLARPGMSLEKFNSILAAQMSDTEKRLRADYIVHTGLGMAQSFQDVKRIVYNLSGNVAKSDIQDLKQNWIEQEKHWI